MHPANTLVVDVLLILARPGRSVPLMEGVSRKVQTSKLCVVAVVPPDALDTEY